MEPIRNSIEYTQKADFDIDIDGGNNEMEFDMGETLRQNDMNSQQNILEDRSDPPMHESVYFVSQKSIFPSGSNRDELLNCSQMTEDLMQRLPDSLDDSRELNGPSDDEEKLSMFMNYDLNLLFDSTKGSMANSAKSSKLKMSQKDIFS